MSLVNITDVKVINNDCLFETPFEFEVTLEYLAELYDGMKIISDVDFELSFQVVYISSPTCEEKDQTLDYVSVGPIPTGVSKFRLTARSPNLNLIDDCDLLGVTAVLIRALYKDCEFVRIGYLVNVEYIDEALKACPPLIRCPDRLYRSILADKPRVTRFSINWENPKATCYPSNLEEPDVLMEDFNTAV